MSLKIQGKITDILPLESGVSKSQKEWKKQNFVIDTGAQFNPNVCFNAFGDDKIALIAELKVGQEIEVFFNVSSREFNGKYYHNLDMWKIGGVSNTAPINDIPATEETDLPF